MTQLLDRPDPTIPRSDEFAPPHTPEVRGFPSPRMPQRVMVRAYRTFGAASRAVDRLVTGERIPRDRVTLVARGLRWAPEDLSDAIVTGARRGAILGAVAGFTLYMLGLAQSNLTAFLPTVIGALVGAVAGVAVAAIGHWRGATDHGDAGGRLEVAHYDVLVDEDVADRARAALADESTASG